MGEVVAVVGSDVAGSLVGGVGGGADGTYTTDDVLMVRQMCLAGLATIDLAAREICVVLQAHGELRAVCYSHGTWTLVVARCCELFM